MKYKIDQSSHSTTESFVLSGIEKFGGVFLTFLFNLLLARLYLSPYEFGIVGIVTVFVALANTTTIGGLREAIIQSKELSKNDIDTVFSFNLVVSLLMYVLLYFLAPYIASYYKQPILTELLRVLSLIIILNAFVIVPNGLFIREMRFRSLLRIGISSQLLCYSIGVFMAYRGMGVWSLVAVNIVDVLYKAVVYNLSFPRRLTIKFDKDSFHRLFSFGGYIYLASLVNTLYDNVLYLILGKNFKTETVGYYTQAQKLQGVPTGTVGSVISQVALPTFSRLQSDTSSLRVAFMKNQAVISFVSVLIMGLLFSIAEPVILILYTDKWAASIEIFQWLCVAGVFQSVCGMQLELIKSLGKGRMVFRLTAFSRALAIISLILLSSISLRAVMMGFCAVYVIFFAINSLFVSRIIKLKLSAVVLPHLREVIVGALSSFVSVATCSFFHLTYISSLFILGILFTILYISLSLLLRSPGCYIMIRSLKSNNRLV